MEPELVPVETAQAQIFRTQYRTTISNGKHTLIADEPETLGGGDTGMNPYALLLASLGSCTAITLRMYIERKQWWVDEITVNLALYKLPDQTRIERKIAFKGEVTEVQITRLLQIAESCPVHKILTGTINIETTAD